MKKHDVIILGAGAAGLLCAATAGEGGRRVLLLERAEKVGKKILISGGGRCNFTNYQIDPAAYLSQNRHFCKSALARYTQWDFIDLVEEYGIPYHEKKLGQLFCDGSARTIVEMLLKECHSAGVTIQLNSEITSVKKLESGCFSVMTIDESYESQSVVVATGGLSIPKMGATPFGYQLAEQFGLRIVPAQAGLVPLTLHENDKQHYESLSGVSLPVIVQSQDGTCFKENLLFTHRGLSGPVILQISSYWKPGEPLSINLLPETNIVETLHALREESPDMALQTVLARLLPKRFVKQLVESEQLIDRPLKQLNDKDLQKIKKTIHHWQIRPNGTEGYRTAEVTLGGVSTSDLSSKTMEAKNVPGLYFIGEVVDVTGWLGGYNFQWAWSSGNSAGRVC